MATARCNWFQKNMLVVLPAIALIVWSSTADVLVVNENCDKMGSLFYEDLGCKPQFEEGKWCPRSYDCGDLSRLNNSCRLHGKLYDIDQHADAAIQGHACQVACTCRNRPNAPAEFLCAILDCPEWLGVPLKPGCHRKYDLDTCCSAGEICDDNVAMCTYRGKQYMDGERIYLEDYCMKCICRNGFSENMNEPFCTRMKCGVQLKHADKVENYCAPAYIASDEEKICCPDSFICPSGTDEVTDGGADGNKCRFGDKEYKIGATFTRTMDLYGKKRDFKCNCSIPPFFTCIEKKK